MVLHAKDPATVATCGTSNQLSGVKVLIHCSQSCGYNPTSEAAQVTCRPTCASCGSEPSSCPPRRKRTATPSARRPAAQLSGRRRRAVLPLGLGGNVHNLPAHHGELGIQGLDGALDGGAGFPGDLEVHLGLGGVRGAVADVLERDATTAKDVETHAMKPMPTARAATRDAAFGVWRTARAFYHHSDWLG